jgi:hypothetical protein
MRSEGRTIMIHKSVHAANVAERMGHPREYHAQFYEQDHASTKKGYRQSSKKKASFTSEMVSIVSLTDAWGLTSHAAPRGAT